jgi:hypothetical protein
MEKKDHARGVGVSSRGVIGRGGRGCAKRVLSQVARRAVQEQIGMERGEEATKLAVRIAQYVEERKTNDKEDVQLSNQRCALNVVNPV